MLDNEFQLIELAIKGESSAFGSLYDHYHPKIYRFVFLKVSRREEAQDITHQVFMNAWQSIPNYKHLGFPFSSWLYQIARNQVIDHYRTQKKEISLEEIDLESLAGYSNPESRTDEKLELEKVRLALGQLKSDYQDVVIMRFVEELSLKETAAALQKSEGAIKIIQHRAIKELRKILS